MPEENTNTVTDTIKKWGALVYVVCSILVPVGYMLHPATADHMHSSRWELTHGILLVPLAMFPLLLGLLYVPRMSRAGWIGFAGFVLSSISLIFIFGLDYIETFFNPVLALEEPGWVARHGAGETVGWIAIVFPLSALGFGLGFILLCLGLRRAGDLPEIALWICIVSVFPMLAGAYFPATFIGYVGPAVFGLGNVLIGAALWPGRTRTVTVVAGVTFAVCALIFLQTSAEILASGTPRHGHQDMQLAVDPVSAPTLDLIVQPDTIGGWNIELKTSNFRFTPQNAGRAHEPGVGHAHLAIDGHPETRLYGPWFYIPYLPPGEHMISVSLNANTHATMTVDGEPVAVHKTIRVE